MRIRGTTPVLARGYETFLKQSKRKKGLDALLLPNASLWYKAQVCCVIDVDNEIGSHKTLTCLTWFLHNRKIMNKITQRLWKL